MARILIIDDEHLVRETLRRFLEKAGHQVVEARDGKQGLERYREDPADLVITDIIMPDTDGIETIIALKHEYPGVKIIAISGGGRLEKRDFLAWAEKLGAQHVLAKPFDSKTIVETVRRAIEENA